MTRLEADLPAIAKAHGRAVPQADLAALEAAGVVRREGGLVRVDPAYRPLARLAAAAFDRHFASGTAKHSVSV